jgi:uncharacterized protein YbjT (DUF2867 family)
MASKLVLVTGATGYVGGRLVPRLLQQGYAVRVLVRDASRLIVGRDWTSEVEVVEGDVLKPETLAGVMRDVWVAYYLIHSMSGNKDFHERDIQAARNFGDAASAAEVERIIYLGGLGDPDANLSTHLRSRHVTGDILRESGIPVTEFRAGVLVGSGSISFEMVRHLTERLPIMISPRWVFTDTQPIAIRNALAYLIRALEVPESAGQVIEIGGADVLTYRDMMIIYAEVRGLRRLVIPVPALTPGLSSHWVQFITPIPNSIARPLIEGLRNESTADTTLARELFPEIELFDYEAAVTLALERLDAGDVETSWSDSLVSSQGTHVPVILTSHEGMMLEKRERIVEAPPNEVYQTFIGIGGERGWLAHNWAWQLRAFLDKIIGGVGFRRGRRHPDELRAGEALDFWRVEELQDGRLMRLRAEMKVPGKAWLQFKADPQSDQKTRLTQTAYFAPHGLFGLLYWYMLYPIHGLVFGGLIRRLGELAESRYRSSKDAIGAD